ncbi:MAG: dTDP-glucose 4,6-dehydratase [Myxococcota bacterium]
MKGDGRVDELQGHTPRSLLVTGGAGFIGCNFLRFVLRTDPKLRVVNLDALTYAGHRASVEDLEADYRQRYSFEHADVCDAATVRAILDRHAVDTIVHLAAETHVDRSIDGPSAFVTTNVLGTSVLLDQARAVWGDEPGVRFHHVSTDEVYGSAPIGSAFGEDARYDPSSPYAASKAGSDHLVRAWHRTYGLPVTASNCSNNYGPYQFPEKLIPLMIRKAAAEQELPVYGDGGHIRDWLHVEDHCRALDQVVRHGRVGSAYNVGGGCLLTNLELVQRVCDIVDSQCGAGAVERRAHIRFVRDRPGHDRRYAVDASKLRTELGWQPAVSFDDGLSETVRWYLEHDGWCRRVTQGRYEGERLG